MSQADVHRILVSPDGRLRVVFLVVERAPGVWSNSPRVIERAGGVVLIDLWNSEWDATLEWLADGRLRLDLSPHGRGGSCALVLDPDTRTFELFDREQGAEPPFDPSDALIVVGDRNSRGPPQC